MSLVVDVEKKLRKPRLTEKRVAGLMALLDDLPLASTKWPKKSKKSAAMIWIKQMREYRRKLNTFNEGDDDEAR